jgi:hypothetical protein
MIRYRINRTRRDNCVVGKGDWGGDELEKKTIIE